MKRLIAIDSLWGRPENLISEQAKRDGRLIDFSATFHVVPDFAIIRTAGNDRDVARDEFN